MLARGHPGGFTRELFRYVGWPFHHVEHVAGKVPGGGTRILHELLAGRVPGQHAHVGSRGLRLTQAVGWTLIALGALVWFLAPPPGFPLTDDPVPFLVGLLLAVVSLPLLTSGRLRIFFLVVVALVMAVVAVGVWGRVTPS
jgi:hypothetical protein